MNRPRTEPPLERAPEDHVYHSLTRGLCSTCGATVDAKIWLRDEAVFFNKYCPQHGHEEVRVASSWRWYLHAMGTVTTNTPPRRLMRPMTNGCPRDCGPCLFHQQRTELGIVRTPEALDKAGDIADIATIRLEGFEPAVLEKLVARCLEAGVQRVEVITPEGGAIAGARLVLIVEVGLDADQQTARGWLDLIASGDADLELRTTPGVTTPDVLALLEEASDGALTWRDFVPADVGHPLCYANAQVGDSLIRVHDLMTAATFDMGRAVQCPTSVLRDDGSSVPACIHDRLPPEFTR